MPTIESIDFYRQFALEKKRIAKSFGSAAKHYELVDQLQRTIADRLIERLDYFKLEPTTILDLGSGPGTSAKKLSKYYKKANITEVDFLGAFQQLTVSFKNKLYLVKQHNQFAGYQVGDKAEMTINVHDFVTFPEESLPRKQYLSSSTNCKNQFAGFNELSQG